MLCHASLADDVAHLCLVPCSMSQPAYRILSTHQITNTARTSSLNQLCQSIHKSTLKWGAEFESEVA